MPNKRKKTTGTSPRLPRSRPPRTIIWTTPALPVCGISGVLIALNAGSGVPSLEQAKMTQAHPWRGLALHQSVVEPKDDYLEYDVKDKHNPSHSVGIAYVPRECRP